jgi:cathepsin B
MSLATAKSLTSSKFEKSEFPEYDWGVFLNYVEVPSAFDSRDQWPSCIHPIRDQGQCGSCWAFGATEVLSDRLCIASGGAINVILSPQFLVDCDFTSFGCNGGFPSLAWRYMQLKGVPSEDCVPYQAIDGSCPSTCTDGSSLKLYKTSSVNSFSTPDSIQAAVLAGGPIEVSFTVYQDFMSYQAGVYIHTWGEELGGHAVKLVGWGVQNNQNFWICANSWSASWGIDGFFNIAFGQCGIDSSGVAGTPKV